MKHRRALRWLLGLALTLAASAPAAPSAALPGPFVRHPANPILAPRGEGWEGLAVFNPSVILDGGRFVMVYRAQDKLGVSRLGLATSSDGVRFVREPEPILSPVGPTEAGGVEDPRLVKIGSTYYLTYTAFDGHSVAQTSLATSGDLYTWRRLGPIIHTSWNKAGAILGGPLDGLYFMYFGDKVIELATSRDLESWTPEAGAVLAPRPGRWDEGGVESGPPPIRTRDGLLLIYNGRDRDNLYAVGAALLSPGDPSQVLARTDEPILSVQTAYEREGTVPNVVFAEGLVVKDGTWYLYYGAGDKVIGLATWRPDTP